MGALPIVGTSANEIIRPNHVSPTVTGGAPTVDGDTIESLGGNDVVAGGLGDDEIHLGAGNDRSIWNVGDGNDFVFGGQGVDTVEMRGSGSFDRFELGRSPSASADANANAIHDLVSANLPLTGIEHVFFRPLGGADIVLVDDLTGTHISQ